MTATMERLTAIITGASRGLGAALARALAERGWRLVIDARDQRRLAALADELSGLTDVTAVAGDIADGDHRVRLASAAADLSGAALLVNNASTLGASPMPALAEFPPDALLRTYRVNVVAPIALAGLVLPQLRATPTGALVNVTSDAAVEPYEGWGGYGSSKAALDHASSILAAEEPAVRVWSVDPGDMRTRMHQDAFPDEDISDRPRPEAVVPAFLRLLSQAPPSGRYRAADLVTGEVAR